MDRFQQLRVLEALLFASDTPLSEKALAERMPDDADIQGLIEELRGLYANRGVTLRKVGDGTQGGWAFRTAEDLSTYMTIERVTPKKLSRAAIETMAIIAYHQPVTRAEIEEIRGVAVSRGTIDLLLEAGWIKPRGRKQTPGRPVTWGTTAHFLDEFGLEDLKLLPGLEELKAAGLLDSRPGAGAISMRESEGELAESDTLEEDVIDPFGDEEPYEALETEDAVALDD
ncbi:MAG: SMC-Scp complex subunit ScpB [Alphaproteobacteria bacterium]|nr:SMC-Scp complex subunit ScpB [Alphaproteobacteria bacterium]